MNETECDQLVASLERQNAALVTQVRGYIAREETREFGACKQTGRHFFRRDYILGAFPTGKPYCMWCGKTDA